MDRMPAAERAAEVLPVEAHPTPKRHWPKCRRSGMESVVAGMIVVVEEREKERENGASEEKGFGGVYEGNLGLNLEV